jgi:hypothetical protein
MATGSSSPARSPAASRRLYLSTGARPGRSAVLEAAGRGGGDLVPVRG